jgi:hypothetical protein
VLRQTGPAQSLVKHFLLGRELEGITGVHLQLMVSVTGVSIKAKGERRVTRRSRLWALAQGYLPDWTEVQIQELVNDLLKSEHVQQMTSANMLSVLKNLDADDGSYFTDLTEILEEKLIAGKVEKMLRDNKGNKPRVFDTPQCILDLAPLDAPTGCRVVMQPSRRCFEAYYPDCEPQESIARTWHVRRAPLNALRFCVDFLWAEHERRGFDRPLTTKQRFYLFEPLLLWCVVGCLS